MAPCLWAHSTGDLSFDVVVQHKIVHFSCVLLLQANETYTVVSNNENLGLWNEH